MDDASTPSERWIDAHSVTCAICGALADERETLTLYLYEQEQSRLEGEAHLDCWDDHECLEDGLFAPDPDPGVEADIDPAAETISLSPSARFVADPSGCATISPLFTIEPVSRRILHP